jgi:outer membrane protein OmpA-like peptidoglycan-associated protein
MSRPVIILLGLLALALLIFLCVQHHSASIQKDIQTRTTNLLSPAPTEWAKVYADGRNIILSGGVPSDFLRDKAVDMARNVYGAYSVENQIEVVGSLEPLPVTIYSPYKTHFRKHASEVILSGLVPDEKQHKALIQYAEEKFASHTVIDRLKIGAGAPDSWLEAAKTTIKNLAFVDSGAAILTDSNITLTGQVIDKIKKNKIKAGFQSQLPKNYKLSFDLVAPELEVQEILTEPLTLGSTSSCAKQFKQKIANQSIHFTTDSVEINAEAQSLLDSIMDFSIICPDSIIEIAGYTDDRGNAAYNLKLSKGRARAVMNKLLQRGIRADKLKLTGYGETSPISDNSSSEGQNMNRRIEFIHIQGEQ